MESSEPKIFNCVDNDDVERLKKFMHYWNTQCFFQIEDAYGFTVLQRAIFENKIAVFDYLLSLEGCPINAPNKKGETALEVALMDDHPEHFAYSLLKKGASIDSNCEGRLLLHHALCFNHIKVAKLLIEKGADLNCQDHCGETPLHCVFNLLYEKDRNELLPMMLYFGADPSIPNLHGFRVLDLVYDYSRLSVSVVEHLLFYIFDDYSIGYRIISIDGLFHLLRHEPHPQILKHISCFNVDKNYGLRKLPDYFMKLFIIDSKYLKLLLEKFDCVVQDIIDASLEHHSINDYGFLNDICGENFNLLLQSKYGSDLIQIINKTEISKLIEQFFTRYVYSPRDELLQPALITLSYGANVYDRDLEYFYKKFRICGYFAEFFRILLHMEIKISDKRVHGKRDIMPGLLYDIHFDIETFVNNPYCKYNYDARFYLLKYFAHPKLQSLCNKSNLPSVPLLVELARNQVRKFLIQKYRIANSMQFYTLIKHLSIGKMYEKIITFETRLY